MEDNTLSQITGWIYFFAWSMSFYGQLYENWKHKNVQGYSLDFQVFNTTGFLFYSLYNTAGYVDRDSGVGIVSVQDLFFAWHALLIILITGVQVLYYPKLGNKVSSGCIIISSIFWLIPLLYIQATEVFNIIQSTKTFNIWILLGYLKICTSLVKYVPQVYLNYKRQSTVGWSIFNVLTDITGGVFSLLQLYIDYLDTGKVQSFNGALNIVKFLLGNVSILFDIIFLVQHYILYSSKSTTAYQNFDEQTIEINKIIII